MTRGRSQTMGHYLEDGEVVRVPLLVLEAAGISNGQRVDSFDQMKRLRQSGEANIRMTFAIHRAKMSALMGKKA